MKTVVLIVTLVLSDGTFGFQILPAPPYYETIKNCESFFAPRVEFYHQNISPEREKLLDINARCVILKVPEVNPNDKHARKK